VVWEGLSTEHVRNGLEGNIELDQLRRIWLPISPLPYLERVRDKRILLVYARYDLTFRCGSHGCWSTSSAAAHRARAACCRAATTARA
jgi:hypothetical protein